MKSRLRLPLLAVCLLLLACPSAWAQPAYKNDVRPNLKPQATLELDGAAVKRSAVKDDPGFRLQYHFKKDGKTVAVAEARASERVDVPTKDAGTYTVVLEVFYPAYRGGTQQKGEYKPVSNVVTFSVEPGGSIKVIPDKP
jgi:hypothetical protein